MKSSSRFLSIATAVGVAVLSFVTAVKAGRVIYNQALVSETALAYNNTYLLPMGDSGLPGSTIDQLSIQAIYSSATIAAATFNDGRQSTGTITVSSNSALIGSSYFFVIGNTVMTQGVDWTALGTASGTAKAISDAIMANSNLNTVLVATWTTAGVVYATSTVSAASANFRLTSSTPAALGMSGTLMTGGLDTAVDKTNSLIKVTAHNFTKALPVLYSTGTAFTFTPLVNQTTYYAVPIDANSFRLSDTSTGAVAGLFLAFTSSSTTGPHNFTLTPLAITGTPSFKFEASNDNANWNSLSVSSVTFASPYTSTSTIWDLGTVNYRYLRTNVVAPTTGGLKLTIQVFGKNSN